ncbi:MAG: hypothetical protein ACR2L2_06480 [Acidobacteriota bacterium]
MRDCKLAFNLWATVHVSPFDSPVPLDFSETDDAPVVRVLAFPDHLFKKEFALKKPSKNQPKRFRVQKLEARIAPGQSHFPPGQFPGGNPSNSGGVSNDPGKSGK